MKSATSLQPLRTNQVTIPAPAAPAMKRQGSRPAALRPASVHRLQKKAIRTSVGMGARHAAPLSPTQRCIFLVEKYKPARSRGARTIPATKPARFTTWPSYLHRPRRKERYDLRFWSGHGGGYAAAGGNPILFLGLGMSEGDVLRPLREFMSNASRRNRSVIALRPARSDELERQTTTKSLYSQYGVHVLHYRRVSLPGHVKTPLYWLDQVSKNTAKLARGIHAIARRSSLPSGENAGSGGVRGGLHRTRLGTSCQSVEACLSIHLGVQASRMRMRYIHP
jgi:hypothetical protein